MRVAVTAIHRLAFDDGSPVRAASAIAAYGDGWLIVQDDSTHGAHWRGATVAAVRLLDPVEGHDWFSGMEGTKHLKPDFESACSWPDGTVLLLGSGSTPARCRGLTIGPDGPVSHDLSGLYARVATALAVPPDVLNLEGACVVGEHLRWFHRGLPAAGWPSASVDLPLAVPLEKAVPGDVLTYDLGAVDGVGLAVTDAVSVGNGRVLVSAAAEDSPNAYDDGPVVASALVLLDHDRVLDRVDVEPLDGKVAKIEGLAVVAEDAAGVRLLATVDADDHTSPSQVLELTVSW